MPAALALLVGQQSLLRSVQQGPGLPERLSSNHVGTETSESRPPAGPFRRADLFCGAGLLIAADHLRRWFVQLKLVIYLLQTRSERFDLPLLLRELGLKVLL